MVCIIQIFENLNIYVAKLFTLRTLVAVMEGPAILHDLDKMVMVVAAAIKYPFFYQQKKTSPH